MPTSSKMAREAATGASERMGGLEIRQPSAPTPGSNVSAIRNRVEGSLPHQPDSRNVAAIGSVPLMDEDLADRARSAVEVLVGAPRRDVDVPVVERQRDVAGGMRQVPRDDCTHGTCRGGEPRDVLDLPGRIVHTGKECHRQPLAGIRDGRLEVLDTHERFAGPRSDHDEVPRRVQAVEPQLRLDRVSVRGERRGIDERPRSVTRTAGRTTPSTGGG